jgi:hypothetical protein
MPLCAGKKPLTRDEKDGTRVRLSLMYTGMLGCQWKEGSISDPRLAHEGATHQVTFACFDAFGFECLLGLVSSSLVFLEVVIAQQQLEFVVAAYKTNFAECGDLSCISSNCWSRASRTPSLSSAANPFLILDANSSPPQTCN